MLIQEVQKLKIKEVEEQEKLSDFLCKPCYMLS